MRLLDVTLYANGTYDRSFEIINAFGQGVLENDSHGARWRVHLAHWSGVGTREGYGLRCTTDDPQLVARRDVVHAQLPVRFGRVGDHHQQHSGTQLNYYYFFYQWNVQSTLAVECQPRADVTVTVSRCTDPDACNYNPSAVVDDGSCEYESCATPA